MSRVLRRPMFRGGIADSEGTGITSGLNDFEYTDGGRVGFQRGGYSTIPGIDDLSQLGIYNPYSLTVNPMMQRREQIISEREKTQENFGINPKTGLPWTPRDRLNLEPSIIDIARKEGIDLTKGTAREQVEARKLFEKQLADKKTQETKLPVTPLPEKKINEEEVSKKQDFKTIYEDLLPIFKASVGPDQDEYTRQKYLELAKFGLNLLKPTPAGVPYNFLSSVATAAEKPLEGYGNIIERERQAAKVPETLALQQAIKLSEPGTVGKAIRDLIQTGAAKNEKEALNIYLKGDSASQKKIALEEKQLIRSDLQGYEGLKGVKDQAIINQLADLVYQDPSLAYKIKGERSKYKPESYEEGAIYIDKGKIVKYKKGQFYTVNEPGFKG